MGIRNFWSLNIDEILVASAAKSELGKKYEMFFPLNSQLKDIDLLVTHLDKRKSTTIQVKGTRTYEPKRSRTMRYGAGSTGWITIPKATIQNSAANYVVFVLHSICDGAVKKEYNVDYLVMPFKHLQKICRKKSPRKGNKYHFFIWIDSQGKRAFDIDSKDKKDIMLSKHLNNWSLLKK